MRKLENNDYVTIINDDEKELKEFMKIGYGHMTVEIHEGQLAELMNGKLLCLTDYEYTYAIRLVKKEN